MKAKKFVNEVRKLSKKYDLPFFFVTDGVSAVDNNNCEAITNAHNHHIEWEKKNGINYKENWLVEKQEPNQLKSYFYQERDE